MNIAVAIIIAYLIGSINSSIIVGKLYKNIDIRKYGSGNAGATNTLRTLGKKAAFFVLIGDVLKGVISVIIGRYVAGDIGALVSGGAVVLGHNYPVYFGFKGGKGILTSISVIMMINWKIGIALAAICLIIIAISRYVSLGSIVGGILFPIITTIYYQEAKYIIFAVFLGAFAVYRHKANIKRLITGKESKLGDKAKIH